jgi:hypothetical protein
VIAMKQYVILLFIFLVSCIGKNDGGTAILGLQLHYVDSNGNGLFSAIQDGQNGYWIDSLKVYDLSDGRKTMLTPCFENRSLSFTFGGGSVLHLCPNNNIKNRYSITLIHVKNGIDDTLKVHIDQNTITAGTNIDSIWYNGALKIQDSAFVKIIK